MNIAKRYRMVIFICLWCSFCWKIIEAIDCYQQPPTATYGGGYGYSNYYYNFNVFTCPPTTGNCFKYVCMGTNYYVQRGCLDVYSPTQRCEVIDIQCRAQGGIGTCYTCSYNRCNGAMGRWKMPPPWLLLGLFGRLAVARIFMWH